MDFLMLMVTIRTLLCCFCLLMFMALAVPAFSAPPDYPVDMGEILSLIRSPEESERTRGIGAASRLGPKAKAAIPDLVRFLKAGDEEVRAHTVFALGLIAPDVENVIAELVNRLADPSAKVRSYASAALSRSGNAAVPGLVRTVSGPGTEARIAAINALGMVRPIAEEAIPLLVKLLAKEPEYASARTALCAIGEAANPELKKAADATDANMRLRVIETFTCMQGKPVNFAPEIIKALRDPDRKVRKAAMSAITKIGSEVKGVAPALIEGLRDHDPELRRGALRAMLSVGSGLEGAIPDLIANLASSDKEIRMDSARVLGAIGPVAKSALPALESMQRDPDALAAQAAGFALGRIRYSAAAPESSRAPVRPRKVKGDVQKAGGVFSVMAPIGVFDKAAPFVTVESSAQFEGNGNVYFSGRVPVSINAKDVGGHGVMAGVATTYFLLDEPATAECLQEPYNQAASRGTCPNPVYREPILLPEGVHNLHYWAVDNAGNSGKIAGMEVFVDGTPPAAALRVNGKALLPGATGYAEPGNTISIVSADPLSSRVASGLKAVYMLIDISFEECSYSDYSGGIDGIGSCENYTYSAPFQLPEGEHVIYYQTEDNLGNVGEMQMVSVIVGDRGGGSPKHPLSWK